MTKTVDMTAMFKDVMGAFPVDTSAMEGSFKTAATLNEKLSGVALSAAEKSADISSKWAKDTLAKIAEHAGVSQGIVIFHFQSKDMLLEQTLRFLSEEYANNWKTALAEAGESPIDKLRALVTSAFSAKVCSRKKIGVWYAFWGETRSRPIYQEVCGKIDAEYSATMLDLCEQMCADGGASVSAEIAALGIEGMIDGLWQNFLIG